MHPYDSIDKVRTWRNTFVPLSTLVAILAGAIAAYIVYTSPQFSYGSFESDTIHPIPPNFSAPLEQKAYATRKDVIGFLPYWAIGSNAKIYPEYMDQIIYFGVTLKSDGTIAKTDANNNPLPEWISLNSENWDNVRSQASQTDTKVLAAVKNFTKEEIETLLQNAPSKKRAIKTITDLMNDYELDGINIDFEYFSGEDEESANVFTEFITELSAALRKEKVDAILSFDVNATVVYTDVAYDMVKIGELMDQVIIMGYDYHQATSNQSGPIAPIAMADGSPSLTKTIESLKGRVPSEKIILGTPLYGFEWQTESAAYRAKTIPGTGAVATYKRVRELIENRDDVSIRFNEISQSPWLSYSQNGLIKQVYYEDERSLQAKIDLIHEEKLDGIALWALGYEGDYIEPWIVIKEGLRTP
ncbi:hypothetical protein KBD81_02995 [Candidatus Woesebacteria bacterium]|nr:hypothetical protein [Candidatus Woesebacteria bacterium]